MPGNRHEWCGFPEFFKGFLWSLSSFLHAWNSKSLDKPKMGKLMIMLMLLLLLLVVVVVVVVLVLSVLSVLSPWSSLFSLLLLRFSLFQPIIYPFYFTLFPVPRDNEQEAMTLLQDITLVNWRYYDWIAAIEPRPVASRIHSAASLGSTSSKVDLILAWPMSSAAYIRILP